MSYNIASYFQKNTADLQEEKATEPSYAQLQREITFLCDNQLYFRVHQFRLVT